MLVCLLDHEQVTLCVARHDLVGGRADSNLVLAAFPVVAGAYNRNGQLHPCEWIRLCAVSG